MIGRKNAQTVQKLLLKSFFASFAPFRG